MRWTLAFLSLLAPLAVRAAEPFEWKDGDRVVLIGGTLIEREQRYGYWEAALTSRWPDRNITFRNLGWSGDTVFGEARAGFGAAAEGFAHLRQHVLELKPTKRPVTLTVFARGDEVLAKETASDPAKFSQLHAPSYCFALTIAALYAYA